MNTDTYKEKLLSEKKKIEEELSTYAKGLRFRDGAGKEEDEEADEAEETATYLGLQEALHNKITHIKKALARIEEGVYGTCEKCGGEIGGAVFDAEPESSLCKSCKSL